MGFIDFEVLADWFRALEAGALWFLLVLALVVIIVGLWGGSLRGERSDDPKDDKSRW